MSSLLSPLFVGKKVTDAEYYESDLDSSFITKYSDDLKVETKISDLQKFDKFKLISILIQLYIEYFMFNTDISRLPAISSEDIYVKPFKKIDDFDFTQDDATRYESDIMDQYEHKLGDAIPEFMLTIDVLNNIFNCYNLKDRIWMSIYRTLMYANIIYNAIYNQIQRCSDFASFRDKNRQQFNDECLANITIIRNMLLPIHGDDDKRNIHIATQSFPFNFWPIHNVKPGYNLCVTYSYIIFERISKINNYDPRIDYIYDKRTGAYVSSHQERDIIQKDDMTQIVSYTSLLLLNDIMNDEIKINLKLAQIIYKHIISENENKTHTINKKNIYYAQVMPEYADMLMKLFGFRQITKNSDDDQIFKWCTTKKSDGTYTDMIESVIHKDVVSFDLFKMDNYISNVRSPYVYVYKCLFEEQNDDDDNIDLSSYPSDTILTRCPTDAAIIETIKMTPENCITHKLRLFALLAQLYIEYYMFNSYPDQLVKPKFRDGKLVGPFVQTVPSDEISFNGHESTSYTYNSMNEKMDITFDKLQIIISTLKHNCDNIDNILIFANILYVTIYVQIMTCHKFIMKRSNVLQQFNDARVYSISTLKSLLIDGIFPTTEKLNLIIQHYPHTTKEHTEIKNDALLNYSHVFLIQWPTTCEAISIQISLTLLNASICNDISCGIAKKLFNYIMAHSIEFECKFLHATAWPIIARILMESFGFIQLTKNETGQKIFKWHKTKNSDGGKYTDPIESIIPNDVRMGNIFNVHGYIHNSSYIFTFKKI